MLVTLDSLKPVAKIDWNISSGREPPVAVTRSHPAVHRPPALRPPARATPGPYTRKNYT